jgi:AraC family transcriptional regulator
MATIVWFGSDFTHLAAELDGAAVECPLGDAADFCVVPAGVQLSGHFRVGPTIEYTAVFIEPRLIRDIPGAALMRPMLGFGHPWLRQSLRELRAESHAQDDLSGLMAEGWVLQAVAQIARTVRSPAATKSITRGGLALWQERRAKEMLAANLGGRISVKELAAACDVSHAHFTRAFRQSTGVPPHRWLIERRIEMAKGLLQHSSKPIAEIAVTCGFSDQSHLTHLFSKRVGHSPATWRRLHAP